MIKWTPSSEFLAQAGHVLLGYSSVVTPSSNKGRFWATGLIVCYMLIKEFSFDIFVENDSVETGWRDFFYLAGGVLIGWGVRLFLI